MVTRRTSQARERMLDAAEAEFAARGFDAATMDQIAATANVSKSHLYYHFDTKDDLLTELFADRARQITDQKDDLFLGETVVTDELSAKVLASGIDRLLGAHPRFFRIAILECFRPSGRADLAFRVLGDFTEDTLARARGYGLGADATEIGSAMTWFALLPILSELLIGKERARVLELDPHAEHATFARLMTRLYTGYLAELAGRPQPEEDQDAHRD